MPKPTTTPDVRVDVHLTSDDLRAALRDDVARGLRSVPKDLPPKWFYDDRGSELFDEITRLPEYYPTRAERSILVSRAADIVVTSNADTLVELGSGTSEKTRLLLDAFAKQGIKFMSAYIPAVRSASENVRQRGFIKRSRASSRTRRAVCCLASTLKRRSRS